MNPKIQHQRIHSYLEGTFNLRGYGDADKYLSISTGYRKGYIEANANKTEIWIVQKSIVQRDIRTTGYHPLQEIMDKWTAPYGIFYTWGGWQDLKRYDYLVTKNPQDISGKNLKDLWEKSTRHPEASSIGEMADIAIPLVWPEKVPLGPKYVPAWTIMLDFS